MENVVQLSNRFNTPAPADTELRRAASPAAPSAAAEVTTPSFLNALLRAVSDRDERRVSALVRKVGYAAYPSLARSVETGTFGHSAEVFEKEIAQAVYALRHPATAKQSKLGRSALKLGLNLDFAVRTAFSGKGA